MYQINAGKVARVFARILCFTPPPPNQKNNWAADAEDDAHIFHLRTYSKVKDPKICDLPI